MKDKIHGMSVVETVPEGVNFKKAALRVETESLKEFSDKGMNRICVVGMMSFDFGNQFGIVFKMWREEEEPKS